MLPLVMMQTTTNQSQESSMRETLNDFAYFQEVWDKPMHPTNTTKKRKSDTKSNIMLHDDDDDDIINKMNTINAL